LLKNPFFRIITSPSFLLFLAPVVLPLILAIFLDIPFASVILLLFYVLFIAIVFYCAKGNLNRRRYLEFENQVLQEKINVLTDQAARELKNEVALHEKINRYLRLKEIIESINQDLSLESIANSLTAITFLLIANQKGTCILYLTDMSTRTLSIFKTKKEDKRLIIKAKEGDVFDHWIVRHVSPLLIEDIRKDFRFDLEKLKSQDVRPIGSFIGAPLVSDHKFLGIMRLDHPQVGFFSQDDLRLLVTICDLAAVALENGELFHRTQDLAIHDGLTSLYTKGYFLERLKEECQRSVRQKKTFSLFMLDIDHFKNYNDEYGHSIGDIVLKNLASDLQEGLKGLGPVTSRFGGEEFCVILPRTDKKRASAVAEALRLRIEKSKINLKGIETGITVSIGVANFPDDASDKLDLILKADRALYEAKERGRNRVVQATP